MSAGSSWFNTARRWRAPGTRLGGSSWTVYCDGGDITLMLIHLEQGEFSNAGLLRIVCFIRGYGRTGMTNPAVVEKSYPIVDVCFPVFGFVGICEKRGLLSSPSQEGPVG
jgi:hypothetical protein